MVDEPKILFFEENGKRRESGYVLWAAYFNIDQSAIDAAVAWCKEHGLNHEHVRIKKVYEPGTDYIEGIIVEVK